MARTAPWQWLASEGPVARRLLVSGVVGAMTAAGAIGAGAPWPLVVLLAWDAAAIVYLLAVWATVLRFDASDTSRHATREDSSRRVSEALLLVASATSLVGVVFGLHRANEVGGTERVWLTTTVVVGVACSWAVVHTVYTLRYADLYYQVPTGGISFPGGDAPDYVDFAYVAFTLGMTFQISDNGIESRPIRRAVLAHCLLSYLFGAVIIATSINVVASLVS